MRKFATILLAVMLMAATVVSASAADKLLEAEITDHVVAIDRNGNEYVRMIISETRELNGVSYERGVPVLAFGADVPAAKALKVGDKLKAVVSFRALGDGRESYTIIKLLM